MSTDALLEWIRAARVCGCSALGIVPESPEAGNPAEDL